MRGGGGVNETILKVEASFASGVGRTLALQSFCIISLVNAEILAHFCTTRNKIKMEKHIFNGIFFKFHYEGLQMKYSADVFARKIGNKYSLT